MNRVSRFLTRALEGWWRVLRTLLLAAGVVAAAGIVATALVVPLWYVATRFRGAYTIASLGVVAAAGIAVLARRFAATRRPAGRRGRQAVRLAAVIGMGLGLLLAAYVVMVLYWQGLLGAAVPATVILLVLTGYAFSFVQSIRR